MGAGRPTKLTPEIQAEIVRNLASGVHRSVAAICAGVSRRTLAYWMRKGREEPDGPYGQFLRSTLEAEKKAEMRWATIISAAAKDDPNHAKWMLTHRCPNRWADTSRRELRVVEPRVDKMSEREVIEWVRRVMDKRGLELVRKGETTPAILDDDDDWDEDEGGEDPSGSTDPVAGSGG